MRKGLSATIALSFLLGTVNPARADYIAPAPHWPGDGVWFYIYTELPEYFLDQALWVYCGYGCAEWSMLQGYATEAWFHDPWSHNDYLDQPDWYGQFHYSTGEFGWFSGFDGRLRAAWDCFDVRSDINQEYVDFVVYAQGGYMPLCGWGGQGFTTGPGWGPFPFAALNQFSDFPQVGVIRNDYLYDFTANIQYYVGYGIRLTSAYRNPRRNAAVGGAQLSRHMWGDAVDLKPANAPGGCISPATWDQLHAAAISSGESWFEPYGWDCSHLHSDVRYW